MKVDGLPGAVNGAACLPIACLLLTPSPPHARLQARGADTTSDSGHARTVDLRFVSATGVVFYRDVGCRSVTITLQMQGLVRPS